MPWADNAGDVIEVLDIPCVQQRPGMAALVVQAHNFVTKFEHGDLC